MAQIVQSLLYNAQPATCPNASKPAFTSTWQPTDENVIDVTGEGYTLPAPHPTAPSHPDEVVPWAHQYVYGFDELQTATPAQRAFYDHFRKNFLQGRYLDLKGNTNYAFILLFDLLETYDKPGPYTERARLEREINLLGRQYPKTQNYGRTFLIERMMANGDTAGQLRQGAYPSPNAGSDFLYTYNSTSDWYLGNQFRKMLALSDAQVTILNRLSYYTKGSFGNIEGCFLQVVKLFLHVVTRIDQRASEEGTSLEENITRIVDLAARKINRYRAGSANYNWFTDAEKPVLYEYLLKCCDNAVRRQYRYARAKTINTPYTQKEVAEAFRNLLELPLMWALETAVIPPPDEETEKALNALSTTRWKEPFAEITANLTVTNAAVQSQKVEALARLNTTNPSVENIWYEAAKAFAPVAREMAVGFYVRYVHADLESARVHAKPLTKAMVKSLFKTETEAASFETLLNSLRTGTPLETALAEANTLFTPKRRKIQLDGEAVAQVQAQHSGTVNILNEVLREDEPLAIAEPKQPIPEPQVTASPESPTNTFSDKLPLSAAQAELLALFAQNNFRLADDCLTDFARSKALFKNSLVDAVNEQCYELLDDVLIEESDGSYLMNADYYQQLTHS